MTYADSITALSDPRRRAIFEGLREKGKSVAEIAKDQPVSRPAISQHLKVLSDAGLVDVKPLGTKRIYTINPDGLLPLRAYLDSFWDETLAAFKDHVKSNQKDT